MQLRNYNLEARLAAVSLGNLDPCDLGDGIDVIHDVEMIEVEMECDLESAPYERIEVHSGVAPLDDTKPSAYVAAYVASLDLGAYVRSPIMDTLPFALEEPIATVHTRKPRIARGSGPVTHLEAETTRFVRPRALPGRERGVVGVATVPYEKYSVPYERIEVLPSRGIETRVDTNLVASTPMPVWDPGELPAPRSRRMLGIWLVACVCAMAVGVGVARLIVG
jgi:hypothetical protein